MITLVMIKGYQRLHSCPSTCHHVAQNRTLGKICTRNELLERTGNTAHTIADASIAANRRGWESLQLWTPSRHFTNWSIKIDITQGKRCSITSQLRRNDTQETEMIGDLGDSIELPSLPHGAMKEPTEQGFGRVETIHKCVS